MSRPNFVFDMANRMKTYSGCILFSLLLLIYMDLCNFIQFHSISGNVGRDESIISIFSFLSYCLKNYNQFGSQNIYSEFHSSSRIVSHILCHWYPRILCSLCHSFLVSLSKTHFRGLYLSVLLSYYLLSYFS